MTMDAEVQAKADAALDRARKGVAAIGQGRMVVVMDDLDRENEGDIICAAEFITEADVAFMVRHSGGILCVPATPDRLHELGFSSMVRNNRDPNNTAFTVSIDYRVGTTTGISAADRAKTFRAIAEPKTRKQDFTAPGHVFPLIYTPGGVLRRKGHTEASVDLCRLAGVHPVAVISELVRDDGVPKRLSDCKAFCLEHDLPLLCVADIEAYMRHLHELTNPSPELRVAVEAASESYRLLRSHLRGHDTKLMSSVRMTVSRGDTLMENAQMKVYKSLRTGEEHAVVVYGDVKDCEDVLVRVHSECLTGDIFGSTRCDCGAQLNAAYQRIKDEGKGVIIYVRGHEGRGIGLSAKIKAYQLQVEGLDTYEANAELGFDDDERNFGMVPEILRDLCIKNIRLLSNNPRKATELRRHKAISVNMVAIRTEPTEDNLRYLLTKQHKGGHRLHLEDMTDFLSTSGDDAVSDVSFN